jgi:hypothetical protein
MVAEPQQAAVTNAVLLGALREEEKENLKHANNRNSVSLFTKGHLFRCVKFILDEKTLDGLEGPRSIGKIVVNKLNTRTGHLLEYVQRSSRPGAVRET